MNFLLFLLVAAFSQAHKADCGMQVVRAGETLHLGELSLRPAIGTYLGVSHGAKNRYLNGLLARLSDGGLLFGLTDYIAGGGHPAIEQMFLKQLANRTNYRLQITGFVWGGEIAIGLENNKSVIFSANETTGMLARLEEKTGIRNNQVRNAEIFFRDHFGGLLSSKVTFKSYDKDKILAQEDQLHLDPDLNSYIVTLLLAEKRDEEVKALLLPVLKECALQKCSWEKLEERVLGIKALSAKEAFPKLAQLKDELKTYSLLDVIKEMELKNPARPNFKHDALGGLSPIVNILFLAINFPDPTHEEKVYSILQSSAPMAILFFEKIITEGVDNFIAEKISDIVDAFAVAYGVGLKYRSSAPDSYSVRDLYTLRTEILEIEKKAKKPRNPSDISQVSTPKELFSKTYNSLQEFVQWVHDRKDNPVGYVEVYHFTPSK